MDLIKFIKILTDKKRLRILNLLKENEMCVCELSGVLRASQPLISHHLSVLKNSGMIKSRKIGYWSYFSLNPEGLGELKRNILETVLKEFQKDSYAVQDLKRYNTCKSRTNKTMCFSMSKPKICPHTRIQIKSFLKERRENEEHIKN